MSDERYEQADRLKQAMSQGGGQARIAETILDFAAMILAKHADYGGSAWKRPVLNPALDPGEAIKVRMSDKIERLVSLAGKPPEVAGETYDDTLRDLAAYALLYLARPKEQADDAP